jgi:hypothetical protein
MHRLPGTASISEDPQREASQQHGGSGSCDSLQLNAGVWIAAANLSLQISIAKYAAVCNSIIWSTLCGGSLLAMQSTQSVATATHSHVAI